MTPLRKTRTQGEGQCKKPYSLKAYYHGWKRNVKLTNWLIKVHLQAKCHHLKCVVKKKQKKNKKTSSKNHNCWVSHVNLKSQDK